MKVKNNRLEALKMLISSQELSSQEQLLQALHKEGFEITQATLSRDLKLLKVAKAASSSGKYAYVLPNDALYKRVTHPMSISKMGLSTGFQSINFSGNMVVIKTRPGYASSTTSTTAIFLKSLEPSQEMTPSSWSRRRVLQKRKSSTSCRK